MCIRDRGKGGGYERWAKKHNLKEMSKTLIFLQQQKISSADELKECADAALSRYHELGDSIKTSEKRLAEIAVLKAHIINYAKGRPVYDAYRKVVDSLYDRFDIKETKANIANFTNSINEIGNDENKLYRERERLVRSFEQKRNELKTYENNMGFFSVKSKSGNSLMRDMERKIQHIKEDLASLEEKIKIIDSKL